jgi:hypothetical protein
MARRDVVLRWIEEFGRLIARLLRRGTSGDLDLALEEIDRATGDLLGGLASVVPRLDAASAAQIIADPDRIFAWAQLVELGGLVAEARGEAGAGTAASARAVELAREAIRRHRLPRPDWAEWVAVREGPAAAG